ncbi:TPA: hypothetical protein ACPYU1_004679 [Raoultella planticola]
MEGVDTERLAVLFKNELDGHVCEVALAMGYRKDGEDDNYGLPKTHLAIDNIKSHVGLSPFTCGE